MIWDEEMTKPSAVDMIAARMPTPTSAASHVGKISMNSSGKAWFGLAPSAYSASPSSARADSPAKPSIPSVSPNENAKPMNVRCCRAFFSAQSLLPRCGSRPSGTWETRMANTDHQEW